MNTPILNCLKEYLNTNPIAFHMPGHKLGKGFEISEFEAIGRYDLTEIPGTDNLHFPSEAILEAQNIAAKAFGADETMFLVNGSTVGVLASILGSCGKSSKVLVSRDCHKSVIGALILAECQPVYISPVYDDIQKVPLGGNVESIISTLDKNEEIGVVFITRPNYYGSCLDIDYLVREVHKRGKVLIVDEAHGAHLAFHERLPKSANLAKADIVIQSAHKTLNALTQGAYLHFNGSKVDRDKVKFYLRILQTSSPSYPIMASLDYAREIMQVKGSEEIGELLDTLEKLRKRIDEETNFSVFYLDDKFDFTQDLTRLVINVSSTGNTGYNIDKALRFEHNIQVEMSDYYNLVCIATIADKDYDFQELFNSLLVVGKIFNYSTRFDDIRHIDLKIPFMTLNYGEIKNKKEVMLPLSKAIGKTCADIITPYPPGVPVICPGEIIMAKTVDYLYNIIKVGGVVNGIYDDNQIKVLV